MSRPSKPTIPKGLETTGARLWRGVVGTYELRPDEVVVLEAACRARDRIAAMEAQRDGAVTATGSMGQLVVHPLVAEIRATEALVAQLLGRLHLPDAAGGGAEAPRSTQAREAAKSRWSVAHGAGA